MHETAQAEPLLLAVGGGKGGVGKTFLAANLAVAMAKLGARVTAVDADLGSSNLHTVFGVDHPGQTLQALLDGRVASLQEVVVPTGYARVDLVPGSVAVPGAANLHHARKQKLLRHLAKLDAEVVIVDCGAGINFNVLDFFAAADVCLVVANAQLVSLQNAYGFLKAAIYRSLRQRAADFDKAALLEGASDSSETETVRQVLERVAARDPELVGQLRHSLASMRASLLGNQLSDLREINAIHALSRMVGDFLGLRVPVLGGLRRLDRIHHSVTRRKPFMSEVGTDPEALLIMQLAESFLCMNVRELREQREQTLPKSVRDGEELPSSRSALAEEALPASLVHYQRAHERLDVDWPATVQVGDSRLEGRVCDISKGGVKLALENPPPAQTVLRIVLDEARGAACFDVKIVHVAAQTVGAAFDPEPDPSVIGPLLELAAASTPKPAQAAPTLQPEPASSSQPAGA
jgi:flagellar biosynthesis protein FlhG